MKRNSTIRASHVLAVGLLMSLFLVAASQAQSDLSIFTGKFALATQVRWDTAVLQPGNYTITITSSRLPILALVRDSQGRPVGRFASGINAGKTSTRNALLLKEKDGQLHVCSLALASLGSVLVYDPVLAREAVMEARSIQTVPVTLAKR